MHVDTVPKGQARTPGRPRLPAVIVGWCVCLVGSWAAPAGAQHADVVPYASGGRLLTGAHDDLGGQTSQIMAVFGYDFGEDPLDPWVIGDPGFNNSSAFTTGVFPNDGKLPTSSTLALAVAAGRYGPLHYWDGTGGVSFAPVSDGVGINLNKGSFNLLIGGATTSGSLNIASTGVSGRVHQHLESSIGSGWNGSAFATQGAPDGLYAFGVILSAAGLTSDPIYLVYNVNLSEEIHDAGIAWYETNVVAVPEPSTVTLAMTAIVGSAWIGRRRFTGRRAPG